MTAISESPLWDEAVLRAADAFDDRMTGDERAIAAALRAALDVLFEYAHDEPAWIYRDEASSEQVPLWRLRTRKEVG